MQEKKDKTGGEMFGWHHQFNGHEFEQVLGDCEYWEACSAAVHGFSKSQT